MTYEKPKCDECNLELVLYEEFGFTVETQINQNGMLSKRPKSSIALSTHGDAELQCPNCCRRWKYDRDEKGRVIKIEL